MAWNADQTRLPFKMHSEYLRELFLNDSLAEGNYRVDGKAITISDIRAPIFAIGTETDHVAPWKSVYKINLLANSQEVTFLLTSGGHNAGIISEPGHPRRSYRMDTRLGHQRYVDPETWYDSAPHGEGSWWPAWQQWLARHSTTQTAPPAMGAADSGFPVLDDAPGTYVFQD
jgi:polyhydroxyalkanoate synthase